LGNPNEYNTNTRLDWSAPQKSENKCEELEGRCRDLANLCRFAGVPQVMIDNPRLTKEDMAWAKKILELEKKKD
jgi:predicted ATP-dependent protease